MRYLLVLALTACGLSMERYQEFREGKTTCAAGETCVLAGSAQCVCPAPVNARHAEVVQSEAERVDCAGAMVECISFTNPRCQDGRCVADAATQ